MCSRHILNVPDPLASLIQADQFVGWACQLDYEQAVVLTNHLWNPAQERLRTLTSLVAEPIPA